MGDTRDSLPQSKYWGACPRPIAIDAPGSRGVLEQS